MSDDEVITATEASRTFSELLARVAYNGQSFVIKKGNKPMARLVSVEAAQSKPAKPKEREMPKKAEIAQPQMAKSDSAKMPIPEALVVEPRVAVTQTADYYKVVAAELQKMLAE